MERAFRAKLEIYEFATYNTVGMSTRHALYLRRAS